MKKRLLIILTSLLVVAFAAGCGGGDKASGKTAPSPSPTTDNPFIGYWYADDDPDSCIAILEDGVFQILYEGELDVEGKYKWTGNTATMTANNESIEASLNGSTLTMTNPEDATDKMSLKRGLAPVPAGPVDEPVDDNEADNAILIDKWYLDGDMAEGYIEFSSDNTFTVYEDDELLASGTYSWDGSIITITLEDGETTNMLMIDEDTLSLPEDEDEYIRESAIGSQSADDDNWTEFSLTNDTIWTFGEVYVYDSESDDEGYNHIASIGSLGPGETCGIGVDTADYYKISLIDEDDAEWYFTIIEFYEGCEVEISFPDDEPIMTIYYADGTSAEETGIIL